VIQSLKTHFCAQAVEQENVFGIQVGVDYVITMQDL
jgi:hypothetical protein